MSPTNPTPATSPPPAMSPDAVSSPVQERRRPPSPWFARIWLSAPRPTPRSTWASSAAAAGERGSPSSSSSTAATTSWPPPTTSRIASTPLGGELDVPAGAAVHGPVGISPPAGAAARRRGRSSRRPISIPSRRPRPSTPANTPTWPSPSRSTCPAATPSKPAAARPPRRSSASRSISRPGPTSSTSRP